MTKKLQDQALALGLTTQEKQKAFEMGYLCGERDTYNIAVEGMKEVIGAEPIDYQGKSTDQSLNVDNKEINTYMEN